MRKVADLYETAQTVGLPADVRARCELLRRKFREKAEGSFWFFLKEVMMPGASDVEVLHEPFHRPVAELLEQHCDAMFLLPRGTLKSTVISVAYPLWIVLKWPNTRVLLISETLGQSKGFIAEQVRHVRQNRLLRFLFPELVTKEDFCKETNWTTPAKTGFTKEASVECTSADAAIISRHYNVIISDDLVGPGNSHSVVGLSQASECWNFAQALLVNSNPGEAPKHTILVGTRWHYADLYSKVIGEDPTKGASRPTIVRGCFEDDAQTIPSCPTMLPLTKIADHRRDMTTGAFSAQYLNKPMSEADQIFKIQDIASGFYDVVDEELLTKVICVDPAESVLDSADYTGIVVVGVDAAGHVYLLHCIGRRMHPSELYNHLYELDEKYNPLFIAIEKNGIGKRIIEGLHEEAKVRNHFLNVREIEHSAKKEHRIIACLEPVVKGHRLHVKKEDHFVMVDQLQRFPLAAHDDLIDALAMSCERSVWGNIKQTPIDPLKPLTLGSFPFKDTSADRHKAKLLANTKIKKELFGR